MYMLSVYEADAIKGKTIGLASLKFARNLYFETE